MRQRIHGHIIYWGLICLLAFVPLVRGGHQVWAALVVAGGIWCFLVMGFVHSLWTGSLAFVWRRQDLVFLVSLLWVLFGSARPSVPPDALDAFLIVLGCLGCFVLARTLAFNGSALWLAMSLCIVGGIIALVGLLQVFGILAHGWWNPAQFVAATFVNHNHFAAYLALLSPVSCALWLTAPLKAAHRFSVAVSCALMVIGVILSCSRGAWVSLAIATATGLGWFWTKRAGMVWTWQAGLIIVAAVGAIGFLISQPPILARGMSLLDVPNDPSFQSRQAMWQGTWQLVKEHPVVGYGLGSFMFEFPRHRPAGLYRLIDYAHNEYLQLVAELGLVGLTLAILIAVLVIRRIARLMRLSQTPWKQSLGLGGLIGLGSVSLHSLVDFPWHIPAVAFTFAALAGLLTGIRYHADPSPLRVLNATSMAPRRHLLRWIVTPVVLLGLVAVSRPLTRLIVADLWAYRGHGQYEASKLDEAIVSYREAIRRAPQRIQYHQRLGDSLVQRAWQRGVHERRAYFKQAADAYRLVLSLVPQDARSAHALGEVLQATGEIVEADQWLSQALTHDPQNPLYWKHWAELKVIRGEAAEAAEAFQRAAALAKPYNFFPSIFSALDDPNYFAQQGESALLLGRLALAHTAFTVASQFDPAHPGAQVGLALCSFYQGDAKTAQQLMVSIHDPAQRAKWFAGLAQHHFKQGHVTETQSALETSLKLDPSNVLARHLQLAFARTQSDQRLYVEAVDQLLSLNRPPVFVRSGLAHEPLVVWEPELGTYSQGGRTRGSWALFTHGAIHQLLIIPPGKARFTVTACGTRAKGLGPTMVVSWNGRTVFVAEVKHETWFPYEIKIEVKPGESLLTVEFPNDLTDPLAHEDRNLKIEKIVVTWGTDGDRRGGMLAQQ